MGTPVFSDEIPWSVEPALTGIFLFSNCFYFLIGGSFSYNVVLISAV